MSRYEILLPNFAMVLLTLIVWLQMYRERLGEMRDRGIDPQNLTTARQGAKLLERTQAADNFRNLFEMPVLFYLATLTIALTGSGDAIYLALAWAFAALRWVHSAIHLSYNRVLHRFAAYAASCIVLWALWLRLAFDLVASG